MWILYFLVLDISTIAIAYLKIYLNKNPELGNAYTDFYYVVWIGLSLESK